MLTHTSGFTYDFYNENTGRYEKYAGLPSLRTGKNDALRTPLAFDPGDRWDYGIGIDWAGKVVEAVSGQSLDVYLREHIFAPLGMTDTTFILTPGQRSRLVSMHRRKPDGSLEPIAFELAQNPEFFSGGGGLYSTARDYVTFLQMLMHGGQFNGVQVLRAETVALMERNHIGDIKIGKLKTTAPELTPDVDFSTFFPGQDLKWGLSFLISAGGLSWAGVANTYFWLDPANHVAGVILTQVLPANDATTLKLYGQFAGGVYKALSAA